MIKIKKIFNALAGWQLVIIFAILFVPLFNMSLNTNLGADADGYISRQLCREPLYPLFLMIFNVFGSWKLVIVRITQSILIFMTFLYSAYWLREKLQIKQGLIFLVLFFMSALVSLHSGVLAQIWSEGIALPIFILTFLQYVEALAFFSIRNIAFVSIGAVLLVLTRQQFFYVYILLFLLLFWHYWRKQPIKKIFYSAGIMLAVIFVGLVLSTIYFKLITPMDYQHDLKKQATAAQWQFKGWRITVQPLFLSTRDDAALFKTRAEKRVFLDIHHYLSNRRLTRSSMPKPIDNNMLEAELYYMSILGELQQHIRIAIATLPPPFTMDASHMDFFMKKMSTILFMHHIKENVAFYFVRVGYYLANPFVTLAFLIILVAGVYRFFLDRNWQPSLTCLFFIAGFLFILTNAELIGLVEVFAPRYFFYSYFLYFCFSAVVANIIFSKDAMKR